MKSLLLRLLRAATVATLATTGLAAPALAAGTGLDGTVTNALTGEPVAGAWIMIQHPDGSGWNSVYSDSAGHYDFPDASGSYVVLATAADYVERRLDATAPGTTGIALMPIQYGSVSGRAFKNGGGGVAGVQVELYRGFTSVARTSTGGDGRYVFGHVETGTYTMMFRFPGGQTLWYDNTPSEFQRTPFQVTPNANTVINVTRPPVGTLVIRAVDAVTGKPVAGFCWYSQQAPQVFMNQCSDDRGVTKLPDILTGVYRGSSYDPDSRYVNTLFGPVTVVENETTTITVRLKKSVRVTVSFVDAATGGPVTGACVKLWSVDATRPSTGDICGHQGVELKNLTDEFVFQMFVAPHDGVHGAQWVSATGGGTGDIGLARVFQPRPGEHIAVTVRLDGAGGVAGVVRDAATGAGVGSVCPTASRPLHWQGDGVCTYDGGYSLRDLGPYEWKLSFPAYGGQQAWAWSGNAANRASATPVRVVAGRTVTLDVALPATGTISGTVVGPAGSCVRCAQIFAIDAATGEHAGIQPVVAEDGTFIIKGLNTQNVWLYYNFGAETFKHPTMWQTTAGGAVTGVVITRS